MILRSSGRSLLTLACPPEACVLKSTMEITFSVLHLDFEGIWTGRLVSEHSHKRTERKDQTLR